MAESDSDAFHQQDPANDRLTPPVLGFSAFSGTGKTTLLCQLIPQLRARGLRLGLIKHSHHRFEADQPGKDSYLLRQAGAEQVVLASRQRVFTQTRYRDGKAPDLDDYIRQIERGGLDLLLVEGYKHALIDKIEIHRPSLGHPLLALNDRAVIAVASDAALPTPLPAGVPLLDINDIDAIVAFMLSWLDRKQR